MHPSYIKYLTLIGTDVGNVSFQTSRGYDTREDAIIVTQL